MGRYHLVVASHNVVLSAMQSGAMIGLINLPTFFDESDHINPHDQFYFVNDQGFVSGKAVVSHVQRLSSSSRDPDLPCFNPKTQGDVRCVVSFVDAELLYPHPQIETPRSSWSVYEHDPVQSISKVNVYCSSSQRVIDSIPVKTAIRLMKCGVLHQSEKRYILPFQYSFRRTYRRYVIHRDKKTCRYCLEPISRRDDLTVDHVIPRALRVDNRPRNLVLSCWDCNQNKSRLPSRHFASLRLFQKSVRDLVITTTAAQDYIDITNQPIPVSQARKILFNILYNNFTRIHPRQDGLYIQCRNIKLAVVDDQVVKVVPA